MCRSFLTVGLKSLVPLMIAGLVAAPALAQTAGRAAPSALPRAPEVSRDVEALPEQVRRMRALILDAVRSGDAENLRRPIEWNEVPPSFGKGVARGARGPAMASELLRVFRERSGDGQGRETMGQIVNIIAVGYARTGIGTRQEIFVWPYFAALDPRLLTPEQEVDAHRVLHADAVREWREKGRYPGWRLGIGLDGTWHYFTGAE
jgi:hypothetical protein